MQPKKNLQVNRFWLSNLLPKGHIQPSLSEADEGAANTIRLWGKDPRRPGVWILVHGHPESNYPSRQEYSKALGQYLKHPIHFQQHPKAIDQGVFHNDVIAFGFKNIFIFYFREFKTFVYFKQVCIRQ